MPNAAASVSILQASRIPVHFISLMLMPVKPPRNRGTSARRCTASSANTGNGLRSVSHAESSSVLWATAVPPSPRPERPARRFRQEPSAGRSNPDWRPRLWQRGDRTHGTYHLAVVASAQLHFQYIETPCTLAALFFHHLGRVYAYGEGSGRSLAGSSPQMRCHGAPSNLPTRSCKAMSTAALAAVSRGDSPST